MVAARAPELRKPIKWYAMPRLFRYERSQKGRLREFFQFNMDILGAGPVAADAELMAAAHAVMRELGCGEDSFRIHINSRDLVSAVLQALEIPEEKKAAVYAILDKRLKVKPEALAEMYQTAGLAGSQSQELEKIFGLTPFVKFKERFPSSPAVAQAVETMDALFKLLEQHGCAKTAVFDFSIVRGLDYYTGLVWEVYDTGQNHRAAGGGGRYDNLIRDMGGESLPAAGFGMGDVVIADMLEDYKLMPEYRRRVDYYIVALEGCPLASVIGAAAKLRQRGYSVEYGFKDASVSKQMQHANAAGAAQAVFAGGVEEKEGKVKVKDLGTGKEETLPIAELFGK
jgi:histidyl-tRNA synthetase